MAKKNLAVRDSQRRPVLLFSSCPTLCHGWVEMTEARPGERCQMAALFAKNFQYVPLFGDFPWIGWPALHSSAAHRLNRAKSQEFLSVPAQYDVVLTRLLPPYAVLAASFLFRRVHHGVPAWDRDAHHHPTLPPHQACGTPPPSRASVPRARPARACDDAQTRTQTERIVSFIVGLLLDEQGCRGKGRHHSGHTAQRLPRDGQDHLAETSPGEQGGSQDRCHCERCRRGQAVCTPAPLFENLPYANLNTLWLTLAPRRSTSTRG